MSISSNQRGNSSKIYILKLAINLDKLHNLILQIFLLVIILCVQAQKEKSETRFIFMIIFQEGLGTILIINKAVYSIFNNRYLIAKSFVKFHTVLSKHFPMFYEQLPINDESCEFPMPNPN